LEESGIVNMKLSDSSDDYIKLNPSEMLFLDEVNICLEEDI